MIGEVCMNNKISTNESAELDAHRSEKVNRRLDHQKGKKHSHITF